MKFKTVDEYFEHTSPAQREKLQQIRIAIKEAIPEAKEVISYNMPAFKKRSVLVYYAAYPPHIGFYPTPSAIEAFKDRLTSYKSAKGSVQFPIDQPMPLDLIADMARFRWEES